nr:WYL domain-containing protein [Lachnospiraceae bacterium]
SQIYNHILNLGIPDTPSRDAVSDALKAMTHPDYTQYGNPMDFGYSINAYKEGKNGFIRLYSDTDKTNKTNDTNKTNNTDGTDDDDDDKLKGKTIYYAYHCSNLEIDEIKLLMDALEAYPYLSEEDATDLISHVASLSMYSLGKKYKNKNYKPDYDPKARVSYYDSYLIDNLGDLRKLISEKQFVKIQNCFYDKDHTLKNCRPEKRKIILPIRVVFANGYYYLVAREFSTSANKYVTPHYRVDRLEIIELDDGEKERLREAGAYREYMKDFQPEDLYDPAAYRLRHPIMFGGKQINAKFLVRNTEYMLNTLQDFFGGKSRIVDAPADIICSYIPDENDKTMLLSDLDDNAPSTSWLLVSVTSSFGGLRLFCLEYCDNIRIISPDDLEENIRKTLQDSVRLYSNTQP